jgi:hypothetical protein
MEGDSPFGYLAELGVDLTTILHGEQQFDYLELAYADDVVSVESRIADVYAKRGGALEFVVRLTDFKRDGELLATPRSQGQDQRSCERELGTARPRPHPRRALRVPLAILAQPVCTGQSRWPRPRVMAWFGIPLVRARRSGWRAAGAARRPGRPAGRCRR